ncbi:uncharacterized protein LTR77_006453 [Saxophila tyrrhenica]|uniref:VOC domain-containing protein n=1 Tax=Saxophila tyrrhenica TaxID=1690608 RepID=A0AAV9PAY8_9PEZI|nr:hypothetical protein LTR77_006453 [Saxophila tyrrhenica]
MATTNGNHASEDMIKGLAHVNILVKLQLRHTYFGVLSITIANSRQVPPGTLDQANEFYGNTLGLHSRQVPKLQAGTLAWFDISDSGQQVHVAFGQNETKSSRHPCFKIGSPDALMQLRQRIWEHHERGGEAAPQEQEADKPGTQNSGSQGVEFPSRFFARDYAGNRLEFSL